MDYGEHCEAVRSWNLSGWWVFWQHKDHSVRGSARLSPNPPVFPSASSCFSSLLLSHNQGLASPLLLRPWIRKRKRKKTTIMLGPGALGKPRGSGWRGRWERGLGWGTHVNPWLFHFNVWQNPLQIKKKKWKKTTTITTTTKRQEHFCFSSIPPDSSAGTLLLWTWGMTFITVLKQHLLTRSC